MTEVLEISQSTLREVLQSQAVFHKELLLIQDKLQIISSIFGEQDKNPKISLAKQIVGYMNTDLKITERLNIVEKKQYENLINFNEQLSMMTYKIQEIEPLMRSMHRTIQDGDNIRSSNTQMKEQFSAMLNDHKKFFTSVAGFDNRIDQLTSLVNRTDGKLSQLISVQEMLRIQEMFKSSYVSNIQFQDSIIDQSMNMQRILADKSDRQNVIRLENRLIELEKHQLQELEIYTDCLIKKLFSQSTCKYAQLEEFLDLSKEVKADIILLKQNQNTQNQSIDRLFEIQYNQAKKSEKEINQFNKNFKDIDTKLEIKINRPQLEQVENKIEINEKLIINTKCQMDMCQEQIMQIKNYLKQRFNYFNQSNEVNITQFNTQSNTQSNDEQVQEQIISMESPQKNKKSGEFKNNDEIIQQKSNTQFLKLQDDSDQKYQKLSKKIHAFKHQIDNLEKQNQLILMRDRSIDIPPSVHQQKDILFQNDKIPITINGENRMTTDRAISKEKNPWIKKQIVNILDKYENKYENKYEFKRKIIQSASMRRKTVNRQEENVNQKVNQSYQNISPLVVSLLKQSTPNSRTHPQFMNSQF